MIGLIVLIASYLFGSLPFGLLIAKWWAGIDVREHGSGNIGATNVYRVVGKPAGLLVFTLDVAKGLLPPVVSRSLGLDAWWQVGAGFAAIFGHNASPFLGFKGGKGISTSLGALFGIAPWVGVCAFALWAVLLGLTGYVSVGSIAGALMLVPFTLIFYGAADRPRFLFAALAGLYAVIKHIPNIKRLRNGTESNFRRKEPGNGGNGNTQRRRDAEYAEKDGADG
jgi:glycerol-3-phosphate acyltransferase PlsY